MKPGVDYTIEPLRIGFKGKKKKRTGSPSHIPADDIGRSCFFNWRCSKIEMDRIQQQIQTSRIVKKFKDSVEAVTNAMRQPS